LKKKYLIKSYDNKDVEEIASSYKISFIAAVALYNKKLRTKKEIDSFLNTNLSILKNPFDIRGITEGVRILSESVLNKEKIFIYGDYDADGVTSTAQLVLILKEINATFDYYLPDRESEGYGLNLEKIREIKRNGYNLLITLDCGISNYAEIDYAIGMGMKVIIIDHHLSPDIIPPADVVIDPQIDDSQTYYKNMCGAGLAYKFVSAFVSANNLNLNLDHHLQLSAIGTIADIVPIKGENRIIVKNGIDLINKTPATGIKYLLSAAGLTKNKATSTDIAYLIGPRINAAGRIDSANIALELLVCEDESKAEMLATRLNNLNNYRKEIEKKIFEEAEEIAQSQASDKVIIAWGENWHEGVIGIVSSKITERYFKPSIIFTKTEDLYKGSGRSISGFDIYKAVKKYHHLTEKCGGHTQAVGLTIHEDNIGEFEKELKKYTYDKIEDTDLIQEIFIDYVIDEKDAIDLKTVQELAIMEPFGFDNEEPLFMINKYEIITYKCIGAERNHLKAQIKIGESIFDVIKFNIQEQEMTDFLNKCQLVGRFSINSFNSKDSVQFMINHFTGSYFKENYFEFLKEVFEKSNIFKSIALEKEKKYSILITEKDLEDIKKLSNTEDIKDSLLKKIAFIKENWTPSDKNQKIISKTLMKNSDKIYKFEIFKLVMHLNKLYNININEEMIIYTVIALSKEGYLDYKYKNNALYIKHIGLGGYHGF
jgi:single-stranded-DNA-specific exonuclease